MKCKLCKKKPSEISEYIDAAEDEGITPDDYVKSQEGTFNHDTGFFYCTSCYIAVGMPLGTA
jgi:hypothetical protein